MLYKKTILSVLIVGLALSAATGYANIKAPFAKNFNVHLTGWDGSVATFSGSVDIHYKDPQAWRDFGYKDGNFYYFNQYWQSQKGNTFTFAGISAKLVDITITLTDHDKSTDHLEFTIKLQPV